MQHDHTLNGLVAGYLPLWKRQGRCHIRLRSAALCFFVATALGFEVVHARVPRSPFEAAMRALFPSTSFVGGAACLGSVDLVMMDIASLPPSTQHYWAYVDVPHLVRRQWTPCVWKQRSVTRLMVGRSCRMASFPRAALA